MKRFPTLLLLLLISCSSVTITPEHLRRSTIADHRRRAAQLIASEQIKTYLPDLIVAMQSDEAPIVRGQSAEAIGQLGVRNKKIYNSLSKTLKSDPDPNVQRDVIHALTELNFQKSLPVLKKKLRSSTYPNVRADAASAIRVLGDSSDTDVLIQGLSDENYMVRNACHDALQNLTERNGPMDAAWWKNHN